MYLPGLHIWTFLISWKVLFFKSSFLALVACSPAISSSLANRSSCLAAKLAYNSWQRVLRIYLPPLSAFSLSSLAAICSPWVPSCVVASVMLTRTVSRASAADGQDCTQSAPADSLTHTSCPVLWPAGPGPLPGQPLLPLHCGPGRPTKQSAPHTSV